MINVLLVEDNPINQFVAVKMLQRWGMEVTVANHGQEALGLVGSKPFELVLMDLDMPVMGGLEAAPLKEVTEWAENYRRFWDGSFERLDEYLQHLKGREKNHGHGK